jgi:glycosyltransferase involved in cell wall biosynthesis
MLSMYLRLSKRETFISNDQRVLEYMPTLEKRKNEPMFPFRYFKNNKNQLLPIVSVSGFFRDDAAKNLYYEFIDNGIKVVGVTAYKSFPKPITDTSDDKYHITDDFDYVKNIKNWLCCFQNPKAYNLDPSIHNLIDISESDFYDVEVDNFEKKYDIIYVCLKDDDKCSKDAWNAINRNYDLALKCLPIMINEYGFKVLFIGRIGCKLEEQYGDRIETTDFLEWHKFQEKIRESRFLFVPNIYDASPRVISESITKGLPVLMNRTILCGSKYVDYQTGELFTDDNDFRNAVDNLLKKEKKIDPRKWWTQNYGTKRMGKKLRDFLAQCYPGLLDDETEVSFII